MRRWLVLIAVAGCCLAADEQPWQQAQREAVAAIVAKARQELAADPASSRGRTLLEVLRVIHAGNGSAARLDAELRQGKVRPGDRLITDREFADLLTARAAILRHRATVGRTDLAIVLARVALLYNPDLAGARDLVPRDEARLSMEALLALAAERREEALDQYRDRQDERDLAATLEKVAVESFVLSAEAPSANLNGLIKLAYDKQIHLQVQVKRIPLMTAGSYHGARLYQSSRLTGPRQDITLEPTTFLEVLRTFCRTHQLAWYADGPAVVITDPATALAGPRAEAAPTPEKTPQRASYGGAELHRAFAQSVSSTLGSLKGRQVRLELVTGNLADIAWRNRVLTLDGYRFDMWNGAAEDLGRCDELAAAVASRREVREESREGSRQRLRIVVTGEVYNYVDGVIYLRQPSQFRWEWARPASRSRR